MKRLAYFLKYIIAMYILGANTIQLVLLATQTSAHTCTMLQLIKNI